METPITPDQLQEHARFVQGLARSLVRNEADAQDAAQETWLAAVQAGSRPVALRAWLAQVLRRRVRRDRLQSASRREREAAVAEVQQGQGMGAAAEEGLLRQAALRHVTDAVLELDEPYRSTILLRFHGGHTAREIAQRQGIPLATVRSRLARALERLRVRLDGDYGDRQAWSVALLSLGRWDQAAQGAVALGSAGAGVGVIMMKAKTWVAVLLVAGCLGWWGLRAAQVPQRQATAEPGASTSELLAPAPSPAGPEAEPLAPTSVADRMALGGAEASVELAPPTLGAVAVQAIWLRDATPAEVWVEVTSPFAPPAERMRSARTDAGGRCLIEGVVPGRVTLRGDRGGEVQVEVVAGEVSPAKLGIPVGGYTHGRVQDSSGAGIPGAEIWLYLPDSPTRGHVVAHSQADGFFELLDTHPSFDLGAMAPGFAPSVLVGVPDALPGHEAPPLVLVLGEECGQAELRIENQQGEPLAGAYVRLTMQAPADRSTLEATELVQAQSPAYRSDEQGRLSLTSLASGMLQVHVTATGMASKKEQFLIIAGDTVTKTLRMLPGGQVFGRVTNEAGQPLQGVDVFWAQPYEDHRPLVRTDAEGRYALTDLPTGSVLLGANDSDLQLAITWATLELQPGVPEEWNPVMRPGRRLTGVVVDWEGRAVVERGLRARSKGALYPFGLMVTDAFGFFELDECWEGDLEIDVMGPGGRGGFVALTGKVGPYENEIRLRLPKEQDCSAGLRLRLAEGGSAALMQPGGALGLQGEAPNLGGVIQFLDQCPGTYLLELRQNGHGKRFLEDIELRAGEVLDLGVIERGPEGLLELLVDGKRAQDSEAYIGFQVLSFGRSLREADDAGVALMSEPGRLVASANQQEVPQHFSLSEGIYLVRANGNPGVASQRRLVTMRGGEITKLDWPVEPGVLVRLEAKPTPGSGPFRTVMGVVADGSGPLHTERMEWDASSQTFAYYTQLPPGLHTLWLRAGQADPVQHPVRIEPDGSVHAGQELVEGPGFTFVRVTVPLE